MKVFYFVKKSNTMRFSIELWIPMRMLSEVWNVIFSLILYRLASLAFPWPHVHEFSNRFCWLGMSQLGI